MTEFKPNLAKVELDGKQLVPKEQAFRICLVEAETVIETLCKKLYGRLDAIEFFTLFHKVEAWKEQKDQLFR